MIVDNPTTNHSAINGIYHPKRDNAARCKTKIVDHYIKNDTANRLQVINPPKRRGALTASNEYKWRN